MSAEEIYSRKGYEKAEEKVIDARTKLETLPGSDVAQKLYPSSEEQEDLRHMLLNSVRGAEKKVRELYKKGQEEAIVQNKEENRSRNPEYNHLLEEAERLTEVAQKAVKAVEDFEKEMFGAAKETEF